MTRSRARIALGLAIFLGAAALGFAATRPLAPARLRQDIEAQLEEILGGEVRVTRLHLGLGLGLTLVGDGVEVWPSREGAALRVERVEARLRPFSHLTGQRRLRRLTLEGARLRLRRDARGAWSPPPVARALAGDGAAGSNPDELLGPLVALEARLRQLLEASAVADRLDLRDGAVQLEAEPRAGRTRSLSLEGLEGRLRQRRILGDVRLELRGRLREGETTRGAFEVEARRSRFGDLRFALAASDLELGALARRLRAPGSPARLLGRLTGAAVLEAPSPGQGQLELDLLGRDVRSLPPDDSAPWPQRIHQAKRVGIAGTLSWTPDHVRAEGLRFSSDALGFEFDGAAQRPLHAGSRAQLALALRRVRLDEVRHLIGWLPDVRREEAEALVSPLERGHLELLRTGGTATLAGWQEFLAGRSRDIPSGFVVDAELADATLRVGESDLIEELTGRLWWTGDRIEVRHARARLNGSELPELDLSVAGISHFFAADPAARRHAPGGPPLPGLRPLWKALAGDESDDPPPPVQLEIDYLDHPLFLWPIRDAVARLDPIPGGVHVNASGASWGGVRFAGEADWWLEPVPRVSARFDASAPAAPLGAPGDGRPWATGHFEVGPVTEGPWQQDAARGRFHTRGGRVHLRGAGVELRPRGRIEASAMLDLTQSDAVPVEVSFTLTGGDVPQVAGLLGLPPELSTGTLEAAGSLRGRVLPDSRGLAGAEGLVQLTARGGAIRQAVPAVAAIAMASQVFNPFARREQVRYERVETLLELRDGRLHTDGFTLEGPDVRAFASGQAELDGDPKPLDVELVLFLFPPVDDVLEKIPLVNVLLLGNNQNLIAAHFELGGTWQEPDVRLVPLRTLTQGPASLVFETLPGLVRRGLRAIGGIFSRDDVAEREAAPPPAALPRES